MVLCYFLNKNYPNCETLLELSISFFFFSHPTKQLVDLSAAQDTEAGDGTTTVTILAGAFLGAIQKLMSQGEFHPQQKNPNIKTQHSKRFMKTICRLTFLLFKKIFI